MKYKRILSYILSAFLILSSTNLLINADNINGDNNCNEYTNKTDIPKKAEQNYASISFSQYKKINESVALAKKDIILTSENITSITGNPLLKENDNFNSYIINDSDSITFSFNVPETAGYNIKIEFSGVKDTAGNMESQILIDDKIPFSEGTYIAYKRTFSNNGSFESDVLGNDIKPTSYEIIRFTETIASDPSGFITEPFIYYLTAGNHKITIKGQSSSIEISKIILAAPENLPTYKNLESSYDKLGYKDSYLEKPICIEAEKPTYYSDITVYPITDRTSPITYPQSATKLKLNTIGGNKWKQTGQWICWSVNIPKDGLYSIAPRFKQSLIDGIYVSRQLKIDGKIPFAEANSLKFNYDSSWQLKKLGDGNIDYKFYLTKGKHEISFEVSLGDIGLYLSKISNSLTELNKIYRDILMITGSVPDTDRDYGFDRLIPDDIQKLKNVYNNLSQTIDEINQHAKRGNYVSLLNKLTYQIKSMYQKPKSIAKNLETFKSNIGSLSTWLLSAREQPLELDRIYILSDTIKTPEADTNIFSKFRFGFKCFLSSFANNYNNIGQSTEIHSDKEITVWIQTGRDQAQIMRQLIDNYFSHSKNIKVNLKLVSAGTLLPSVLASKGPDVALNNGQGDPINYAIRNANIDLTQFSDFKDITSRFCPSSLIPYSFNGKTYALPETLSFPMFFYRSDIFDELGINVPQNWNELMALIPVLQRHNMTMAFPTGLSGYALLLYQNGGELYQNNGEKTNLISDTALDSFQEFTEIFTLWQMPVQYDFANRFRTGEMPCGIQDYTLYNNLVVFAPEIKGLWNFIPIPGKLNKDGSVNNISIAGGTNVMIMRGCKDLQSSWEFIKWWTDSETQSLFGIEMESALGVAAKQPTANREALIKMSWTSIEAKNISNQLNNVKAIPEVPGGYYTSRIIDFAFNRVYNNKENPVEVIGDYTDELNDELTRKRAEFGLK